MALRFNVQLVMIAEDGEETAHELIVLDKEHERIEQLGLSLAEAKLLLRELQQQVLERQIAAFLGCRVVCPACGRARGIKDRKSLWFRTLFGKLALASPRLRQCCCEPNQQASFSPLLELLPERTAELQEALEHTKWNLWHGKVKRAHEWLRLLEGRMRHFASRYARFSALARAVHGFQRYLWRNGDLIPNYAARRRAGQTISTAFVESLVNALLSKRFAKKQSMQWTPEGAHLLLQARTRTLNGALPATFRTWYPASSVEDQTVDSHALAA